MCTNIDDERQQSSLNDGVNETICNLQYAGAPFGPPREVNNNEWMDNT
jgi:hypothetical protein